MSALLFLVLAAPGTIRVEVAGEGVQVIALQEGVERARAAAVDGIALLRGLPNGSYDVYAVAEGRASRWERGVRSVDDGAAGVDVRLEMEPVHPVSVRTREGAIARVAGRPYPLDRLLLPVGIHRLLVDHPRRVSSAERLVRVTGPTVLEVPLEPGLVVVGRVVDGSGRPVAGARVEAFSDGFPTRRWMLTDSAGNFGLSGFRGDVISLAVVALGYAERLERLRYFPGEERTRVEIALDPGSGAVLTAVDESGRALPDAEAVLLPLWYEQVLEEPRLQAHYAPHRRSGGRRLRFTGLTPGRRYRILVHAPARLPAGTEVFTAPPAGRAVALPSVALAPAAALEGTVEPAASGIDVVCEGPEGRRARRTDRMGRFVFEGLDDGPHLVRLAGLDARGTPVEIEAGQRHGLVLRRPPAVEAGRLEGRVTDADGEGLGGVIVSAGPARTVSDETGAFLLRPLPAGAGSVRVLFTPGPDCRALAEDPHLPLVEEKARPNASLTVRLQRSATLRLAFEIEGPALSRATLRLSGTAGWKRTWRLPRGAREVSIPELALGAYEVEIDAPGVLGTAGAVVPLARGASKANVVRVARGRTAAGKVVLRRTTARTRQGLRFADTPLAEAWVSQLGRPAASTPVDEDGGFVLRGLPPETVLLAAAAPGLPAALFRVDLTRADAVDLVLRLQEGVAASVVVSDRADRPLPGARVRVIHELGVDVRDLAALGRFRRVVAGEEDLDEIDRSFRLERLPTGRITAAFLPPGSYRFMVSADGYRSDEVGVRARTAWTDRQIREDLPGLTGDLAPRVRLSKADH